MAVVEPSRIHLSLNVADLEASIAFYEAFFGVPTHKRRPGYANFDLLSPPLKLALNQGAPTPGGTLNHLGILVDSVEAVAATRDRLKNAGLATFDEGETVCCWARQDKVWATDPDGNAWEVYTLLDEMTEADDGHAAFAADRARLALACCASEPCCTPAEAESRCCP